MERRPFHLDLRIWKSHFLHNFFQSLINLQRQTVLFSGHVQGVGFRYTTKRIAGEFEVVGYVRNLSDGRVELVAEGMSSELSAFVDKINNVMQGFITETTCDKLDASGEFDQFEIRY